MDCLIIIMSISSLSIAHILEYSAYSHKVSEYAYNKYANYLGQEVMFCLYVSLCMRHVCICQHNNFKNIKVNVLIQFNFG
jgi:hypothetical protein